MYKVNGVELTLEQVLEIAEDEIDNNDKYDEWLDEVLEPWTTGTLTFYPSQILRNCDPVAYRVGYSEYMNFEIEDLRYDLERMSEGEELEFYGITIVYAEEEKKEG